MNNTLEFESINQIVNLCGAYGKLDIDKTVGIVSRLHEENELLTKDNVGSKKNIDDLKKNIGELKKTNENLVKENTMLKKEIKKWKKLHAIKKKHKEECICIYCNVTH